MTENRNYYKKKIILFLFVITTVFGIISLYQYYRVKIENPFQLLSAVLYVCGSAFSGGKWRHDVRVCQVDGTDSYIRFYFHANLEYPIAL